MTAIIGVESGAINLDVGYKGKVIKTILLRLFASNGVKS